MKHGCSSGCFAVIIAPLAAAAPVNPAAAPAIAAVPLAINNAVDPLAPLFDPVGNHPHNGVGVDPGVDQD